MSSEKKKKKHADSESEVVINVMTNNLHAVQIVGNEGGDQFQVTVKVSAIRVQGEPGHEMPVPFHPNDVEVTMPDVVDMTRVVLMDVEDMMTKRGVDLRHG